MQMKKRRDGGAKFGEPVEIVVQVESADGLAAGAPPEGVGRNQVLKVLSIGAVGFFGGVLGEVGLASGANARADRRRDEEIRKAGEREYNRGYGVGQAEGYDDGRSSAEQTVCAAANEAKSIARTLNREGGIVRDAVVYNGELQERDPNADPSEWTTTPFPLVLAAGAGDTSYLGKIRTPHEGGIFVVLTPYDKQTMQLVRYANTNSKSNDTRLLLDVTLQARPSQNSGPQHPIVYGWVNDKGLLLPSVAIEQPASMK
jgi:hypothetical protein